MSRHDRIEQLPLVHPVAVGQGDALLDALLARREHELFELAMRGEQHFGGRRLESHAPLGADDGVAEVDAAADAERRGQRLEPLDECHRERALLPSSPIGPPLLEAQRVMLWQGRMGEGMLRQHPGALRECCPSK